MYMANEINDRNHISTENFQKLAYFITVKIEVGISLKFLYSKGHSPCFFSKMATKSHQIFITFFISKF